jgi:hypothetical protein
VQQHFGAPNHVAVGVVAANGAAGLAHGVQLAVGVVTAARLRHGVIVGPDARLDGNDAIAIGLLRVLIAIDVAAPYAYPMRIGNA